MVCLMQHNPTQDSHDVPRALTLSYDTLKCAVYTCQIVVLTRTEDTFNSLDKMDQLHTNGSHYDHISQEAMLPLLQSCSLPLTLHVHVYSFTFLIAINVLLGIF